MQCRWLKSQQIEINRLHLKIDNRLITLDHFSTGLQANHSNHFHLLPTQINGLNVIETVENQLLQKLEQLDVTNKPTQEEVEKPMDWQTLNQALNQPLLDKKQTLKLPLVLKSIPFPPKLALSPTKCQRKTVIGAETQ